MIVRTVLTWFGDILWGCNCFEKRHSASGLCWKIALYCATNFLVFSLMCTSLSILSLLNPLYHVYCYFDIL